MTLLRDAQKLTPFIMYKKSKLQKCTYEVWVSTDVQRQKVQDLNDIRSLVFVWQIQRLIEMGFTRDRIIDALRLSSNDIEHATSVLLSQWHVRLCLCTYPVNHVKCNKHCTVYLCTSIDLVLSGILDYWSLWSSCHSCQIFGHHLSINLE